MFLCTHESTPYPQLVVVTPWRPKDPRRPVVDGLPRTRVQPAGAAQVAVQQMRGPHVRQGAEHIFAHVLAVPTKGIQEM